jgi:hypothetical protein
MIVSIIGVLCAGAVIESLLTGLFAVYKAGSSGSTSLTTNLFAVYNAESNANDSKGSNNGTAVGGLTYTAGKIGNAFTFNGTNAYVSLPDNCLNITGDFSVNMWVNLGGVSGDAQMLLSNAQLSSTATTFWGWELYVQAGTLYIFLFDGTGSYDSFTTDIGSYYYSFSMYTMTITGSSVKLYRNSNLINTFTKTKTITYTTTHTPSIGVRRSGYLVAPLQYYCSNGTKIDTLDIQTKGLSSTEITELYNSALGSYYSSSLSEFVLPNTQDSLGAYNGTAVGGLTYGVGKSGNAFKFNGTNSAVSLPNNMFNSFVGDFSFSAWVYIPNGYLGVDIINIVHNLWAPSWAINLKGFRFVTYGNLIQFTIADGSSANGGTGFYTLSYAITFTTNTWYHIVVTRKESTRTRLYLNGSLVASDTNAINPVMHTTMTPQIGRTFITGVQDGYYAPANTMIDELLPYTKELTATEVTDLYNSGTGKFYPTF